MDTATTATYTTTIGTIAGSGQVHLAHGTGTQHILCRFGRSKEPTTATLAQIPEGESADVCGVLHDHGVKLSKLCKNCFSVSLRKRYREQGTK